MPNPSMVEVTMALDIFMFVSTLSPASTMGSAGGPSWCPGTQLGCPRWWSSRDQELCLRLSTPVAEVLPISGQEVKLW